MFVVLILIFLLFFIPPIQASTYPENVEVLSDPIPDWVKNNLEWWSERKISNNDLITGMKYLINKNIIEDHNDYFILINDLYFDIIHPKRKFMNLIDGPITPVIIGLDPSKTVFSNIENFDKSQKVAFVYPTFTFSAYQEHGFYDFYRGDCDISCLSVPIKDSKFGDYTSSINAAYVLSSLGYDSITDIDVDTNPEILYNYDKIILLHNEYVTENEFYAITNHPKVVYLYPNALYAKVIADYNNNIITLVRGHGYPSVEISNGFDWEYDNTHPYEYDNKCKNWEFYEINNGIMLNCYPESIMMHIDLLKIIWTY